MKIAITGKGGVGKTTLTALLAYALPSSAARSWRSTPIPRPVWAWPSDSRRSWWLG